MNPLETVLMDDFRRQVMPLVENLAAAARRYAITRHRFEPLLQAAADYSRVSCDWSLIGIDVSELECCQGGPACGELCELLDAADGVYRASQVHRSRERFDETIEALGFRAYCYGEEVAQVG